MLTMCPCCLPLLHWCTTILHKLKALCFLSLSRCSLLLFPALQTGERQQLVFPSPQRLFLWGCQGWLTSRGKVCPWVPNNMVQCLPECQNVLNFHLGQTQVMRKRRYVSFPVSETLQHVSGPAVLTETCFREDKNSD